MASEKDPNQPHDRDSMSDRVTLPGNEAPGAAQSAPNEGTNRSLDEMTPEMFGNETVKRLLGFTKIIGTTGHAPSILDDEEKNDAVKLTERIVSEALSFKKFAPAVEMLLNGIMSGKFREEDVVIPRKKLIEALQFWLYYRIEMKFGQSDDQDSQKTRQALIAILEGNILGDNPDEVVTQIMTASVTAETRSFVAGVGKDYLDAGSRRRIVDTEQEARRAFEQQFRDAEGKFVRTIAPPGHVPVPHKAPQDAAQPGEKAAEKPIAKVDLEVAFWGKDGDYDERDYDTAELKSGGRIDIFDTDNPSNVFARIEVQADKIVLVRKGNAPVFDLDNGVPVDMLELREGQPCRIQIGEKMYEITAQVSRGEADDNTAQQEAAATGEAAPAGAQPESAAPSEPAAKHEDSQPQIEARESTTFNLPAVIGIDSAGNPQYLYACLDENDKIVTIGTDDSNDIVLPENNPSFRPFHAEIKFLPNGRIFTNAGKDAIIRFRNSPPNAFISGTPVIYDVNDEILVGENGRAISFTAMFDCPLTETDIRHNLQSRLEGIARRFDKISNSVEGLSQLEQVEKLLKGFQNTLAVYSTLLIKEGEDKHDITGIATAVEQLDQQIGSKKTSLEEQQRREQEEKMALRQHFDAGSGETVETPRPHKYAVLVEKIGTDQQILHVIFPPSLTTGRDPVNALELQPSRVSKYAVQDNECTFVLDGTQGVRMVIEPRNMKGTKILINGQLPGTREGKTHELDMLRPPLKDGDVVEIGTQRFVLEMNHEFTVKAIKPYAVAHLKQAMEVLVLLTENSDDGEKRNAAAALQHFTGAGLVTEAEVKEQQADFEKEKEVRELTKMASTLLDNIREQNQELTSYIETGRSETTVGLPYDCSALRTALELLDEQAVNWDATGWTPEQYRDQLVSSARVRLFAYDKKLLHIRTMMQESKFGTRLIAMVSKDADAQYQQERESLERSFNMVLKEMISLMKLDLLGQEYEQGWLGSRLSQEQYRQAELIGFAHDVVKKIHEGENFTTGEVHQLLMDAERKTYGDFFNAREVEIDTPLEKFVLAKIKARAQLLIVEAREGMAISENLARLEELIKAGLLTYEKIESSPDEFNDLRQDEEFYMARNAALKAGREALEPILSSVQPDLEAVVDFSRRLAKNDIALTDEEEEEFKEYCRNAFTAAVEKARFGEMRSYVAVLAMTAVRLKALKPSEIGTSEEELEHFHTLEAASEETRETAALIEDVKTSGFHNLHPLIKLARYLGDQPDAFRYEGQTAEMIVTELVRERLENMMSDVVDGEEPGIMAMILEDMRQYGFETHIERCVGKGLEDALNELFDGRQTVDTVRPFLETLRFLKLWDVVEKVQEDIIQEQITRSFDKPDISDISRRIEEFGEQLKQLGLRDQLPK